MTPNPDFGFEQTAKELILGIVDTVADIPGLTKEQRFLKRQTTVSSVMAFHPRDPLQIMLAGHCVIYDAMLRDGAGDLLRGQPEEIKLRSRSSSLTPGRMFLTTLHTLLGVQAQETGKAADLPGVEVQTVTLKPPVSAPPSPRTVSERRPETTIAPRTDAAIRLPESEPSLPVAQTTFRAGLRGTASHIAMSIQPPDALALAAVANRAERNRQAGTVSTARTQRAIAPVAEIATGISPCRQASTA